LRAQQQGASSPIRILLGLTIYAIWVTIVGGLLLFFLGSQGLAALIALSTGLLIAPACDDLLLGPRRSEQHHGGLLALQRAGVVLMTAAMCLAKILSIMFIVVAELGNSRFLAQISVWFDSLADWLEDQINP
jgi:hypothetical protein